MGIVQQNSGTVPAGTSPFNVTLPAASNASNRVVLIIFGNADVTTPGWTRRRTYLDAVLHTVMDRQGDGASSWAITAALGGASYSWAIFEIENGFYDGASHVGPLGGDPHTTLNLPTLQPVNGVRRVLLASYGLYSLQTKSAIYGWTNSFTEVHEAQAAGTEIRHGVASRVIDPTDGTGVTTTASVDTNPGSNTTESGILAAYASRAQGAYTALPAIIPPLSADGDPYTLASDVRVGVDGEITHLRYYQPAAANATISVRLWDNAGTLIETVNHAQDGVAGWKTLPLVTPVAVTAGETYRVGYTHPAGQPGYAAGVANTDLPWPVVRDTGFQVTAGYFGSSLVARPTTQFPDDGQGTLYWADLVVTSDIPEGSADITTWARGILHDAALTLGVAATPPEGGSVASYSWTKESGEGTLTNSLTAAPTYTAPSTGVGKAVIRVTVTFANSTTATDTVEIGYGPNVITAENALTGTDRGVWDLQAGNKAGSAALQGFVDGYSVNKGDAANFKIANTSGTDFSIAIYRVGFYGGTYARHVANVTPTAQQQTDAAAQPVPTDVDPNSTKKSSGCGNWSTTAQWTVPSWVPSGVFIAKVTAGAETSHVIFVVRDDARFADVLLKTSDMTWQAYNAFGGMDADLLVGNSLYYGTAVNQYNSDRAKVVSYDRPIVNRASEDVAYGAVSNSTFFNSEIAAVAWLERNGYDVKYYGSIDAAADAAGNKLIDKTSVAISVGHDEYWTQAMVDGWSAARDAGVSLVFWSGNEVFWRVAPLTLDAGNRPRNLECWKTTIDGLGAANPEWTGTWRDADGAGKGGDWPENQLTGQSFVVNGETFDTLQVPFDGGYSAKPMWRDTAVAALTAGQTWTSPPSILGFEYDTYGPDGVTAAGAKAFIADPRADAAFCSDATHTITGLLLTDAGAAYGNGDVTHRMVVYPAASGAMVWGAGTVNWTWGLEPTSAGPTANQSDVIKQASINVLADMGAFPATIQPGMTTPTAEIWFADDAPPSVPTNLTTTVGVSQVTVAWAASTDNRDAAGAIRYVVQRAPDASGAPGTPVTVHTDFEGVSWVDTLPNPGQTFHYRVAAKDSSGNVSAYTPWRSAVVPPENPDPSSLTATHSGGDITLSWAAPGLAGTTHVDVFRRTPATGETFNPAADQRIARVAVGTTTYIDRNLDAGEYEYQVFPVIEGA